MRFLSLRAIFLLGFVVAMPVLALPPVARRIDEWLYGPPPAEFASPPVAAPLTEELSPPPPAHIAQSRYDEPSPATTGAMPIRTTSAAPPMLAPTAPFALPLPRPASPASTAPETRLDEGVIGRLQQIRQRLEQLGAEYVMVESQDGGAYRFHCRMLVDPRSRFTRSFEASSFDAIAAGEQVLRDVESWRAASGDQQARATP